MFRKMRGNTGMIYIPDRRKGRKKHPCPDCFCCNWCGSDRCLACRKEAGRSGRNNSKKIRQGRS